MMYQYQMIDSGLGFLMWLIVLADLVLLGVWLWRQLRKGEK
jgi:hypothetical protein